MIRCRGVTGQPWPLAGRLQYEGSRPRAGPRGWLSACRRACRWFDPRSCWRGIGHRSRPGATHRRPGHVIHVLEAPRAGRAPPDGRHMAGLTVTVRRQPEQAQSDRAKDGAVDRPDGDRPIPAPRQPPSSEGKPGQPDEDSQQDDGMDQRSSGFGPIIARLPGWVSRRRAERPTRARRRAGSRSRFGGSRA